MRSLHETADAKVIYSNPALLAIVAGLYTREVIDLAKVNAPVVLGGNCQSARIVHTIAIQLNGCGFSVGQLILIELRMKEVELRNLKWDGPVALIWGADSHHNPFSAAHRPSSRRLAVLKKALPLAYRAVIRNQIKRVFTGGVEISIVPGVHGAFFQSANIEGLAATIKKHMGSPAKQ
jgi:hypothetical protein